MPCCFISGHGVCQKGIISFMEKFFKIKEHGSTVKTEIMAGLTTFFAMAYIIFVNPNQVTGFTEGLDDIWNAVYVASILVATIGTLLMSLYARMPFAQACGMGLKMCIRDRDVIVQGAEMLGWDLDQLLSETLEAMKTCEEVAE